MNLSESEIQVLASLEKAGIEDAPSDRASLEKNGERFWIWLEDWSGAYSSLIGKGLIEGDESGYRMTESGRPLGRAYHRERPDRTWYYYQRIYQAAFASAAHSRLCERAFGKDLCQEGMVDMPALEDLVARLDLGPGKHLLDLGCGIGVITEYISDQTGARVTGLDYAAPAIAMANERTADKRDRLTFVTGDMNALELPARSFDVAISLDTLYWVADLGDTLSQVAGTLKPGGHMGIFYMQGPWGDDPPGTVPAAETKVGQALSALTLAYDADDYTAKNVEFHQRQWKALIDLRDEFEAEGNGFIVGNMLLEIEADILPAIEAEKMTRYLYHVRL